MTEFLGIPYSDVSRRVEHPPKKEFNEERVTNLIGQIKLDNEDLWKTVVDPKTAVFDYNRYSKEAQEMIDFEQEDYNDSVEISAIMAFWDTARILDKQDKSDQLSARYKQIKEKARAQQGRSFSKQEIQEMNQIRSETDIENIDSDEWENNVIGSILTFRKNPKLRDYVTYFWKNYDRLSNQKSEELKENAAKIKSGIVSTLAAMEACEQVGFEVAIAPPKDNAVNKIDFAIFRERGEKTDIAAIQVKGSRNLRDFYFDLAKITSQMSDPYSEKSDERDAHKILTTTEKYSKMIGSPVKAFWINVHGATDPIVQPGRNYGEFKFPPGFVEGFNEYMDEEFGGSK